jgi:hypothetical protein
MVRNADATLFFFLAANEIRSWNSFRESQLAISFGDLKKIVCGLVFGWGEERGRRDGEDTRRRENTNGRHQEIEKGKDARLST